MAHGPDKICPASARAVGDDLGVNWDVVDFDQWREGMRVELEHGSRYGEKTNVTGDDLKKTGQIALAHLFEAPDYYKRLGVMETQMDTDWAGKEKPSPILGGFDMKNMAVALLVALVIVLVAVFAVCKWLKSRPHIRRPYTHRPNTRRPNTWPPWS